MRSCGALNNGFPNSTADLSQRAESKTVDADEPPLQEQRQKGTHSLQVKEETEWLCIQPAQDRTECHLSFKPWQDLKETDTTMGHKGTS